LTGEFFSCLPTTKDNDNERKVYRNNKKMVCRKNSCPDGTDP
jgi:hypothetical protein